MRRIAVAPPARARGQSLVEYAIIVPVFLLILLGMLEFGFAFSHHLTMEYATREGARDGCRARERHRPQYPTATYVDNQIIAAVQRVLTGGGSQVDINEISRDPHLQGGRGRQGDAGTRQRLGPGHGPGSTASA